MPLAVSGALLFSFLGLTTLNIYSQVGLITLVGLVSKNGILIVQFANHLQETGVDKLAAVIEAAGTRLRPILMTTAATVAGHFPLVIATGPGAGARNSIGIMLVSGMIIGTVFTLFVVPSIYMLVARKHSAEPSTETAAVERDERTRSPRFRPSPGLSVLRADKSNTYDHSIDRDGCDGSRRCGLHGWSQLPTPRHRVACRLSRRCRNFRRIPRRWRT